MGHHTPPEPGKRPLNPVHETRPTCAQPHECSWGWRERLRVFELKFINPRCDLHSSLPTASAVRGLLDLPLGA